MGGPSIPQRNLGNELGDIFGAFKSDELPAYRSFVSSEPLLAQGSQFTLEQLQAVFGQMLPVLQRGGALTTEQEGDVRRATAARFEETGQSRGNQYIGQELLNRDQYRQQRFAQALGFNTQALQDAIGMENARTGNFATLINPLLAYGSDLNSSNQNAAGAQSAAGSNKTSGIAGGAISAVGSIAAAY